MFGVVNACDTAPLQLSLKYLDLNVKSVVANELWFAL